MNQAVRTTDSPEFQTAFVDRVDRPDAGTLNVGDANATQVNLADTGVLTECQGSFRIVETQYSRAQMYKTTDTFVTVTISASLTDTPITGTLTTLGSATDFTQVGNTLRYDGATTKAFRVRYIIAGKTTNDSAFRNYRTRLYKNSTGDAESRCVQRTDNVNISHTWTGQAFMNLSTNDTVDVRVANLTDTTNWEYATYTLIVEESLFS